MTAADVYEAIDGRLSTASIVVLDHIDHSPSRPYYLVTVRPGAPLGRRLTHDADTSPVTAWVMAVNNSPTGCTFLVERAIGLLDNFPLTPAAPAVVTFTGPVVEDDGPGDWRWSQGVEVRVFNPKEY